ncbi:SMI1/KNR4 family protein [Rapidithrix thailandica]|uniref:SMI1/KNR4 family protein n=1 Tax=Rapidithrix thailandica TaxID=413964 RepID=A0AAW9RR71_9BACT
MKYLDRLKASNEFSYWNGADKNDISKVEETLNVKLPDAYKLFLSECGMCNFGDTNILGIAKSDNKTTFPVMEMTLVLRKDSHLQNEYIVLQYDVGEFVVLYNVSDRKVYEADVFYDSEKQVKIGKIEEGFSSFDDFFDDFILLSEEGDF